MDEQQPENVNSNIGQSPKELSKNKNGPVIIIMVVLLLISSILVAYFLLKKSNVPVNTILSTPILPSPSTADPQQFPTIGNNTLETGQNVMVEGIVQKGTDVGRGDYCPEGFYLMDDTGTVQLQTNDKNANFEILDFFGKRVKVSGEYRGAICEALTCGCDDSIVIETINILQ